MEKKSMGTFLAALRKASGMTQKQLAEMLNVSDKAVSRWERDECAPDLALIPVIAEIYGITSDELLRGQRRNPDTLQPQADEKKTEKQLRYLLNDVKTKLRIRLLISVTVAAMGLLSAMVCNLGFLRGYLGFFLGTGFYIAAAVMTAIFLIAGYSAVNNIEFDGSAMDDFRSFLIRIATQAFTVIAVLFTGTLPLILFPWDPYLGLDGGEWMGYGLIFGAIGAFICILVSWLLKARLIKTGFLSGTSADEQRNNLRKKTLKLATLILVLTLIAQWAFNQFTNPTTFVSGTKFYDWSDFQSFMQIPTDYDGNGMMIAPEDSTDTVFITENGSYIYPENTAIETVQDKHGKVLCSYENLNLNVAEMHFSSENDDMLPVTVYTNAHRLQGANIRNNINTIFFLFYFAECIGMVIFYLRKSKQIR